MQKKPTVTFIFVFFLFLIGCNKEFNKAFKSNDVTYIISRADDFISQKRYSEALDLYERAAPMARGSENARELAYKTAMANFYNKNYTLSAYQFKNFYTLYPSDEQAEQALFYSAYSHYKGSADYNLDQSNTYAAIEELQNFADQYPYSVQKEKADELIRELNKKLEEKYFQIAKIYYDIMHYKASIKAFEAFINDFPDSPLTEKAEYYMIKAEYELSLRSVEPLEKERFQETLAMIDNFISAYPSSSYGEQLMKIKKKASQTLEQMSKISAPEQ